MGILVTDACDTCNRMSHWPEDVFARTGRTCARCLEARPELLMALVAAEGHRNHPYRSAPAYQRRRHSPEALRLRFMLALAVAALALSAYLVTILPGVTEPRVVMALIVAGWGAMVVHLARSIRADARG